MLKKWKRSIIRLSIVGSIIGLGTIAGIQGQKMLADSTVEQAAEEGEGNSAGPSDESSADPSEEGDSQDKGERQPGGAITEGQSLPPAKPNFDPPAPAPNSAAPKTRDIYRANDNPSDFVASGPQAVNAVMDAPRNIPTEFAPPANPPIGSVPNNYGGAPARPPLNQLAQATGGSFSDSGSGSFAPSENQPLPPLRPTPAPTGSSFSVGDTPTPATTVSDAPATTPRFDSGPQPTIAPPPATNFRDTNPAPSFGGSSPTIKTPTFDQEIRQPNALAPARSPAPAQPSRTQNSVTTLPEGQTSAEPGSKNLEGVQAPSLTLEKIAPREIQVGRPAMFQLKVRNVGKGDAKAVTIIDRVPKGTQFVDASPEPTQSDGEVLIWNLDTIKSGGDTTISVNLIPTTEGEIGSVATVGFQSQASVRTICTKPVLSIKHSMPNEVLIGQSITMDITVTNNGTGAASGVLIEEDVPENLSHPAGNELEFQIGTLQPGETKKIQLTLQAKKAGQFENVLLVRADGNLLDEDTQALEVISPKLNVALDGPTRRYLERQATYTVAVQNPGTAKATNIDLIAHLPKGLKFVSTNNQGQYDANTHAVYWSLAELPANQAGEVELTALPIEIGEQKLRVETKGDLGVSDELEQPVLVEGLAAIFFGVADTADPIEVGSDTVYHVKVVNQGSKTATNVRVEGLLPTGIKPIGGDGPTTYKINNQTIYFEPLARLAPKDQAIFKIQARGVADGDHRIMVKVATDEVTTPVSKEESTRVYSDR